jgi:hypothetical protein
MFHTIEYIKLHRYYQEISLMAVVVHLIHTTAKIIT